MVQKSIYVDEQMVELGRVVQQFEIEDREAFDARKKDVYTAMVLTAAQNHDDWRDNLDKVLEGDEETDEGETAPWNSEWGHQ